MVEDRADHELQDDQLVNQPQPNEIIEGVDEDFYGWENPSSDEQATRTRRSLRTPKPTEKYRHFRGYSSNLSTPPDKLEAGTTTGTTTYLPKKTFGKQDLNVQQGLSSTEGDLWRIAMDEEYASLMKKKFLEEK